MIKQILILLFFVSTVEAVPLTPLRSFVIFPVMVDHKSKIDVTQIWSEMRNQLTQSQKYLVATYEFMQEKEVFQPRGELNVTDSIILGRLLGADVLITTEVNRQRFVTVFYDARSGLELWRRSLKLNPAFKLQVQLEKVAPMVIKEFKRALPFLGIVERQRNGKFKVYTGVYHNIKKGDSLELITINTTGVTPVFDNNFTMQSLGNAQVDEVGLEYVMASGQFANVKNNYSLFARKATAVTKNTNAKNLGKDQKEAMQAEQPEEFIEPVVERKKLWLYTVVIVLFSILLI